MKQKQKITVCQILIRIVSILYILTGIFVVGAMIYAYLYIKFGFNPDELYNEFGYVIEISDYVYSIFEGVITIIIGIIGFKSIRSLPKTKVLFIITFVQFIAYLAELIIYIMIIEFATASSFIEVAAYVVLLILIYINKRKLRKDSNEEGVRSKNHDLDDSIMWSVTILLVIYSIIVLVISSLKSGSMKMQEYTDKTYEVAYIVDDYFEEDDYDLIDSYYNGETKGNINKLFEHQIEFLNDLRTYTEVDNIYFIKMDDRCEILDIIITIDNYQRDDYTTTDFSIPTNYEYVKKIYKRMMKDDFYTSTSIKNKNNDRTYPYIATYLALLDTDGNPRGLLCVEKNIDSLQAVRSSFAISIGVIACYIIIITVIICSKYLNKHIVNPLQIISDEAKRFSKSKDSIEVGEELKNNKSAIREINSINYSVLRMENDIINYIDNIQNATKKQQRIATELNLAQSIQEQSLPHTFPAFPDRNEFDLYAYNRPAKEVGGDFYDYYLIDDDHLAFVMADVSGKGIPAALFMMVSKIIIKMQSANSFSPSDILTQINERVVANNKQHMFVTVWLGILELSTGRLVSSNAGHDDPAIFTKENGFIFDKEKHGLPIGVKKGYKYIDKERVLEPGNKIFLYTDGIPESEDKNQNMFGLDRLLRILNDNVDSNPKDLIDEVLESVDDFVGVAVQFDDITTLCLEYREPNTDQNLSV